MSPVLTFKQIYDAGFIYLKTRCISIHTAQVIYDYLNLTLQQKGFRTVIIRAFEWIFDYSNSSFRFTWDFNALILFLATKLFIWKF